MNWKKVKLGEICDFVTTGKTPPTEKSEYFDGGINWITPSDFKNKNLSNSNRTISQKAINDKKVTLFPSNTLLISCIGDIGKVGILRETGSSNQQITAVKPNKDIDVDYLYYFIKSKKEALNKLGNNSVVPILNSTSLKKLDVFYPESLIKQQHIAKVLDQADALRQQNRQLLAHYDELLQSIFIDLFGDPVKNEKGWEVKKLGKVCNNNNSKRIPVKDADRKDMQGVYPYYGATGIIDWVNDYKFEGEYLLIAEDGKNLLFRKKPNAFIATGQFWVNNHAHVVSCNGIANLRFLEYCFNRIDLTSFVTGIDQFKLTRNALDIIPIIIPPFPLQQQFAQIVEQIEEQKAVVKKSLAESEILFEGLLAEYFA